MNKQVHFIWINKDVDNLSHSLTFPQYVALKSFQVFNPDWQINLHTNCEINIGDLPCIIRKYKIDDFPFKALNACHYPDYLRYKLLHEVGGMYCDINDTITVGSFSNLPNIDVGKLNAGQTQGGTSFKSGWLYTENPGVELLDKVLKEFPTLVKNNRRNVMERHMDKYMGEIAVNFNYKYFYPLKYSAIMVNREKDLEKLLFPETRQIHYFTLSDSVSSGGGRRLIEEVSRDNYLTHPNTYAQGIRRVLKDFPTALANYCGNLPIIEMADKSVMMCADTSVV